MKPFNFILISLFVLGFLHPSCSKDKALEIDYREGKVLRIPEFDLRYEGAKWGGETPDFFKDENGKGYYEVKKSVSSLNTIPLIPNRSYILSILIKPDFERVKDRKTREVNIGLRTYDEGGKNVVDNLIGIPISRADNLQADEWQRFEWEFTVAQAASSGRLLLNRYNFKEDENIKIADVALIQLPEKELVAYKKGDGVTFRGGPGSLPMKIERTEVTSNKIEVQTTGALYSFDLENNGITACQLIEKKRDVSTWEVSVPMDGLEIIKSNDIECILANDNITFGVQCDGLMMVSPQKEAILKCKSEIGGEWNRLANGHLIARDTWGGFAVNLDIPLGTGRLARVDANVRTGRVAGGDLDFSGYVDNKTFISSAKPGWIVKWGISPGERIAISVFPPRPYPWKESFSSNYTITNNTATDQDYKEWSEKYSCKNVIMWNFFKRGWGGSFFTDFELYEEKEFEVHVEQIKNNGMTPCPYLSPYFYRNRDPNFFVSELRRIKESYGVNGVYYDGIPSQEWVNAYELMRMSREVLDDGIIIFHNTGHASNGTPPLGEVSLKIPAVETYANITYGGEQVWGHGADWVYPKYIQSQYGLANCIGTHKAGHWEGIKPYQRDLILLKYNGRSSMLPPNIETMTTPERLEVLDTYYLPILRELEKEWLKHGEEEDFYNKYYLPKFNELTKGLL